MPVRFDAKRLIVTIHSYVTAQKVSGYHSLQSVKPTEDAQDAFLRNSQTDFSAANKNVMDARCDRYAFCSTYTFPAGTGIVGHHTFSMCLDEQPIWSPFSCYFYVLVGLRLARPYRLTVLRLSRDTSDRGCSVRSGGRVRKLAIRPFPSRWGRAMRS